jgi:glycosyltransferase involved in cell wall biosynthesis
MDQGPRKLLFVSTLYHPHAIGGAEATVRMLAEETVRRGGEAVVATLSPEPRYWRGDVNGVRVHYLPLANLFFLHGRTERGRLGRSLWHLLDAWNPVMAGRLGAVLDAERPDLVNAHNLQGFSVAAWEAVARRRLPLVQTLHDYYLACANSAMFRCGRNCAHPCAACRVLGYPRRRLSSRPRVVTSVSRRLFERIREAGVFADTADVRVIPNANAREAPERTRHSGRPLHLGFLGRLEPVKGLEVLLETAARLPAGSVAVTIGGSGRPIYEAELMRRFAGPGVEFRGWVDPDDFLDRIDALVVPSLWEEPLSRVSHEALGHGVPVIASRTGGIPEVVRDGATGFLFPPGDGAALEAILRRLVNQPPDWRALARRCREQAARFRLETIFAAYQEAWTAAWRS